MTLGADITENQSTRIKKILSLPHIPQLGAQTCPQTDPDGPLVWEECPTQRQGP